MRGKTNSDQETSYVRENSQHEADKRARRSFIIFFLFCSFVTLLSVCSYKSISCVPAGYAVVQKSWSGHISDSILLEGITFHVPWVSTYEYSIKSQSSVVECLVKDENSAVSRDMQTVDVSINIAWYANPGRLIPMFRYIGADSDLWFGNIVQPVTIQAIKSTISHYSLREIIQQRELIRNEIAVQINSLVEERLVQRNPELQNAIIITQVTLGNIDYSDEFEQAIEETQRAEQNIILSRNQLRRFEIDQQQTVVQAQMTRQATLQQAYGEVMSRLIKAEAGLLENMSLVSAGVDVNFNLWLQKWSGTLPELFIGAWGMDSLFRELGGQDAGSERMEEMLTTLRSYRTNLQGQLETMDEVFQNRENSTDTITPTPEQTDQTLPVLP